MRSLLILTLAAAPVAQPAQAAEDPFASLTVLSEEEMRQKRGRLNIGGYQVDIGISYQLSEGWREVSGTGMADEVLASFQYDAGSNTVYQNDLDDVVLGFRTVIDVMVTDLPVLQTETVPGMVPSGVETIGGFDSGF
jgi:hypothetical protein